METYGFNLDKFEDVLNITSKMKELNLKVIAEMNELGIRTEEQELDEKLYNLAMRGVDEQGQ